VPTGVPTGEHEGVGHSPDSGLLSFCRKPRNQDPGFGIMEARGVIQPMHVVTKKAPLRRGFLFALD
jgi:hypothetical protein